MEKEGDLSSTFFDELDTLSVGLIIRQHGRKLPLVVSDELQELLSGVLGVVLEVNLGYDTNERVLTTDNAKSTSSAIETPLNLAVLKEEFLPQLVNLFFPGGIYFVEV